jgi:hypothetical protein
VPDTSPPAAGGGGSIGATLKSKMGPLPTWGWLALITAVLLGYWLLTKNKSGASSSSSGQQGTPSDVGQPGVVVINQDGPEPPSGGQPPIPMPPVPQPPTEPQSRQITLDQNETLGELAKQRHWSGATLQAVENENVMQGGGKLTAQSKLKKGQTIIRPLKG